MCNSLSDFSYYRNPFLLPFPQSSMSGTRLEDLVSSTSTLEPSRVSDLAHALVDASNTLSGSVQKSDGVWTSCPLCHSQIQPDSHTQPQHGDGDAPLHTRDLSHKTTGGALATDLSESPKPSPEPAYAHSQAQSQSQTQSTRYPRTAPPTPTSEVRV